MPNSPPKTARPARPRPHPRIAAAILALLVALPALIYILSGYRSGANPGDTAVRAVFDQELFHLKAIQRFAQAFPTFDFRDYESATTPGYHLVLSLVERATQAGRDALRIAGLCLTIALFVTLALAVGRRAPVPTAVALCLPLLCSSYVFSSAVYTLPDNAAWLGVTAILVIALAEIASIQWFILAGSTLVLLVLTRQVHIWCAGVIVAGAWLVEALPAFSAGDRTHGLIPPTGERMPALRRAMLAAAFCVPALALLALFVSLWHGLTPPAFQPGGSPLTTTDYTNVAGISPITPGFILANFGLFGLFFLPLLPNLRERLAASAAPAILAAFAGFVIAALPLSTFKVPERMSGLWSIVSFVHERLHVPYLLGNRTLLVIVPAALGAALLVIYSAALARRDRWIILTALAGFTATQTTGALAWQRYVEPFLLILLSLICSRFAPPQSAQPHDAVAPPRWAIAGPITLAALLAATTVISLSR